MLCSHSFFCPDSLSCSDNCSCSDSSLDVSRSHRRCFCSSSHCSHKYSRCASCCSCSCSCSCHPGTFLPSSHPSCVSHSSASCASCPFSCSSHFSAPCCACSLCSCCCSSGDHHGGDRCCIAPCDCALLMKPTIYDIISPYGMVLFSLHAYHMFDSTLRIFASHYQSTVPWCSGWELPGTNNFSE